MMKENPLVRLEALGQSIWMDFIHLGADVGKGLAALEQAIKAAL